MAATRSGAPRDGGLLSAVRRFFARILGVLRPGRRDTGAPAPKTTAVEPGPVAADTAGSDGAALAAAVRAVLERLDEHAGAGRRGRSGGRHDADSGSGSGAASSAGTAHDPGAGAAPDSTDSGRADSDAAPDTDADVGPGSDSGSEPRWEPGSESDSDGGRTSARDLDPRDALPTLNALVDCFGLSPFERDVLLLAAAVELDPTTGSRCAAAGGDPARSYPTFALALAALDEPHWSALTPVSPLRRWRLIELADESQLTNSPLRVDERVLHFLAGSPYLDARLHGMLRRVRAGGGELPPTYDRAADHVAAGMTGTGTDAPLRVELVGGEQRTRADIAAAAAHRVGLGLYAMAADDIPTNPAERDAVARLWQREALLLPAALLVEFGEMDRDQTAAAEAFVAGAAVPLIVSSQDPRRTGQPRGERVSVTALTDEEQTEVWADAFSSVSDLTKDEVRGLVAQFQLPPHVVRSVAATVRRELPAARERAEAAETEQAEQGGEGGEEARAVAKGKGISLAADLAWRAGLTEARMGLDELGRRIEPTAGWNDLVLPERQLAVLREIVAQVRQRGTVYTEWGFSGTLRRGLGVTALFAGGSGTGKTLAAEVVAKALGLDLFVIDLSQVVSKYIGETEKNLRAVFDAAERGGALLLFDEADALFGKRSEVKDSHDRYANLEVSYLLMRMEAYRGLAVLTTNMKQAIDPAFMRRIRFVVDFPFPSETERAEIWRRVLPARAPTKNLDTERLAQLTVAGGSIRNIALSGAFLAAEEGDQLQMRHVLAAARTEYLKLERSLTPSEVRGWV